ncbi:unnamed protein product, partial [Brassica oleracea var. botrytis]
LRHAEEQGDIEEAATRLAQSNLVTNHLEPEQVPNEETPERIPASHRLGPANEAHSAFDRLGPLVSPLERVELPRSVQTPLKRKPGRPSLRCATPLSLAMISACIRKRRVSKATKSSKTIPRNEENTTKTSLVERRTAPEPCQKSRGGLRLYRKIGSAWKLSPLVIAILILELPMKGMYPMLLLSM